MSYQAVLLPVFVEVLLVFVLLGLLGRRRFAAVRAGEVRRSEVSAGEKGWPPGPQCAANAFSNQFELPVLFLAIVPLAILTRKADLIFVVLSWIFVLSRIAHAAIYVTTNHVPYRFAAYAAGALALLVMWIILAIRVLVLPLPA